MSLPEKLIAVGMRYQMGAEQYLNSLRTQSVGGAGINVLLRPENNKEANGGIAYAVYHRDRKLAYIREADLPMLKREAVSSSSIRGTFPTLNSYEVTEIRTNYLILKLSKTNATQVDILIQNDPNLNPCNEIYLKNEQNIKKEETMFDKIVNANKTIAVTGAYMEAGRIANNQVTKLVAAKAPLMVKGYIDTPIGKVILANLTMMAVDQFRPTDVKLKKVANAMGAVAYQELIQTIDIEGLLNELTSSEGIKAALAAVAGQEEVVVKA